MALLRVFVPVEIFAMRGAHADAFYMLGSRYFRCTVCKGCDDVLSLSLILFSDFLH